MSVRQQLQLVNGEFFRLLNGLFIEYENKLDHLKRDTDMDQDGFDAAQAELNTSTIEGYVLLHVIGAIDNLTTRIKKK